MLTGFSRAVVYQSLPGKMAVTCADDAARMCWMMGRNHTAHLNVNVRLGIHTSSCGVATSMYCDSIVWRILRPLQGGSC
jgi:hypothetical protein